MGWTHNISTKTQTYVLQPHCLIHLTQHVDLPLLLPVEYGQAPTLNCGKWALDTLTAFIPNPDIFWCLVPRLSTKHCNNNNDDEIIKL